MVASIDREFYNTSKFHTSILSPLQNQNGYTIKNPAEFSTKLSNVTIETDETMVSIDIVSLFTAIPAKTPHYRNRQT
jgi:hypothetical protein